MNTEFPEAYIEKIYAGWLGKAIGVRLGAAIEGWTYEQIRDKYGALENYPVNYKNFAADDDTNGPLFFLRALEDRQDSLAELQPRDIGNALLNYAPYEDGFFWWGGYGVSTEHTAYLNLRNGIPAPRSGSIAQNGAALAEQIGGQIFIDSWGLVSPGNPEQAARLAEKAASVTHGGNGVYGGIFVAVCISLAFEEQDILKIIRQALTYIPEDSEYTRVVEAVISFWQQDVAENGTHADWEHCFHYVRDNFGYDRYPGAVHIIPNIAVMILALLYGDGDFSNTINICNRCGWDTDCNVGNVGTIMGVRNGLDGIPYERWRAPINDLLICSSVIGSLNIMDLPYGAAYMVQQACSLSGMIPPPDWQPILQERIDSCHFEFPGSTHVMRSSSGVSITNTDEEAHTGKRSLKIHAKDLSAGSEFDVRKKTYYTSKDFDDSRYNPAFSPLVYPGQTIHASVLVPEGDLTAQPFAQDLISGEFLLGEAIDLPVGDWRSFSWQIPPGTPSLISEAGLLFTSAAATSEQIVYLDDLYFSGQPDYSIDFSQAEMDHWHTQHIVLPQFTKQRGLVYLEDSRMHLTCADLGEIYTGRYDWTDYTAEFRMTPILGETHRVNVRVQGAMRSYAAAFLEGGEIALLKNDYGYLKLAAESFEWKQGQTYEVQVVVSGPRIQVAVDGKEILDYVDESRPHLTGGIGYSVAEGSHLASEGLWVSR